MTRRTSRPRGLSTNEVQKQRARFGPNALPEAPPEPLWRRALRQFQSPLIYVLLFALGVDLVVWASKGIEGFPFEALAIAVILLLNAGLGVWQERKAEGAIEKLSELAAHQVWTMRDGELVRLTSRELVPGEVVRLEAGDRVPADAAALTVENLSVDESVLTSESFPVEEAVAAETFVGTPVVRGGKSYLEVIRTGPESAMGRLATMLGRVEAQRTPLEQRLEAFGHRVARWILVLAALIGTAVCWSKALSDSATSFSLPWPLTVAAVPEGLPAVLTVTLALGVERMAKRKAVVRRLAAVEALGSVTVIATDKTGTLMENRMGVKDMDSPEPGRALRAMVLANETELEMAAGDPLEIARWPSSIRRTARRMRRRGRLLVTATAKFLSPRRSCFGRPEVAVGGSHPHRAPGCLGAAPGTGADGTLGRGGESWFWCAAKLELP